MTTENNNLDEFLIKQKIEEREKEYEEERERKLKLKKEFSEQDVKFDDLGGFFCFIVAYMGKSYLEDREFRKEYSNLQKDIEKLKQDDILIKFSKELKEKGIIEIPMENKIFHLELNKKEEIINLKILNKDRKIIEESLFPIPENLLNEFKGLEKIEPWNKSDLEKNPWDKTEDNPWDKSNSIDDEDMDNPWAEKLQSDKENENSLDNELELD